MKLLMQASHGIMGFDEKQSEKQAYQFSWLEEGSFRTALQTAYRFQTLALNL